MMKHPVRSKRAARYFSIKLHKRAQHLAMFLDLGLWLLTYCLVGWEILLLVNMLVLVVFLGFIMSLSYDCEKSIIVKRIVFVHIS